MGPNGAQEQGWQGLAAQAVLQSQPGAGQGKCQCSPRPEHWAHSWGQTGQGEAGRADSAMTHSIAALERQMQLSHVAVWQLKDTSQGCCICPEDSICPYQAMKPHCQCSFNPSSGLTVAHIKENSRICLVETEAVHSAALSHQIHLFSGFFIDPFRKWEYFLHGLLLLEQEQQLFGLVGIICLWCRGVG